MLFKQFGQIWLAKHFDQAIEHGNIFQRGEIQAFETWQELSVYLCVRDDVIDDKWFEATRYWLLV